MADTPPPPFPLRNWHLILILLLFTSIPLWRAVYGGEIIGPHDQVLAMEPWNGPEPRNRFDILHLDGVLQFTAWRSLVWEAWRTGEPPLWNPFQLMGTPLLANSQSAGFYPPHVLLGFGGAPLFASIALLAWMHLAWAGAGVAMLARRLGASRPGAMLAAGMVAGSAFFLGWVPLASVGTTASWIPWCLFLTLSLARSTDRRGLRTAAGLAVCVGMMVLGGHLQFAAYGLMATVVFGLVLLGFERRWQPAVGWVAALALGGCLAAPQVLPTLAFGEFSHRRGTPTEEGYNAYLGGAIRPFELVGVAFPRLLGMPGHAHAVEVRPGQVMETPQHWPAFARPGGNFAESALAIGPLAFAGLFLLRRRAWRPETWGIAAVGAFGLLLALGTHLNRLLYFEVPGWSATGSPGRAAVLFVVAACLLAACGFGEEAPEEKRAAGAGLGVFALGVLSLVVMAAGLGGLKPWVGEGQVNLEQIIAVQFLDALPWVGVAFLLAAVALACFAKEKPWLGLAAGLACQVALVGPWAVPTSPQSIPPAERDPSFRLAFVNADWYLLSATPALMPPNTATLSGLVDFGGYDSLLHRDTVAWMREVNGGTDPAPQANGNMMLLKPDFDPIKLAESGVSEVWSRLPLRQLGEPTTRNGEILIYVLPTRGRAFTPQGRATILHDGFSHQVIEAEGPGPLIVRDRNMPGWTAWIGGREVPIAGDLWREVELPEGDQTVEFRYNPPGLSTGLGLGGFAVLALAGLIALGRKPEAAEKEKLSRAG